MRESDDRVADDCVTVMPKRTVRSKKEKDLGLWLGDEYADKVAADSRPWYLRPNYRPEDIIIEADGVRGGTVAALVERLTAHEHLSECRPLLRDAPILITSPYQPIGCTLKRS